MPSLWEWNTNTQTVTFCAFASSLSVCGRVTGPRLFVALHMNRGRGGLALLDWMCSTVGAGLNDDWGSR